MNCELCLHPAFCIALPTLRSQQWDWVLAAMPYGSRWRKIRAELHRFFEPAHVTKYVEQQAKDSCALLENLLDDPENFMEHIKQ